MNFVEELKWRGMVHNMMPGTEELLEKEMVTAYLGIDPTADSLHIGHLCGVMMLRHFQRCGHKPLALVGGATGMIGDPSGKSQERNLLDEETLRHNQECIKKQLGKFLDFESDAPNRAELVNNYDWMKDFTFLDFARTVGKHITVNYMMAKDSVQKRLNGEARDGLSFTEFTYQLLQGYDFLHLYETRGCKLQLGGSDQWGNITTGAELIRRTNGGEVFALTCPLVTKADGTKFGKTESGNVWLDPRYTSPYKFYQFWLNVSDEERRNRCPDSRTQGSSAFACAPETVGKGSHRHGTLRGRLQCSRRGIGHSFWKRYFCEGVPQFEVAKTEIEAGIKAVDLFVEKAAIFPSKGEMRKMVQGGGVSLNKEKLTAFDQVINPDDLLDEKYLLVQRGKKNYFLIIAK